MNVMEKFQLQNAVAIVTGGARGPARGPGAGGKITRALSGSTTGAGTPVGGPAKPAPVNGAPAAKPRVHAFN